MKKINILIVIGTRPEVIKMAPVIKLLRNNSQNFSTTLCVTGQHKEMLHQALSHFDIVPDIDLEIMTHNQNLVTLIAKILISINDLLLDIKPDLVLVHGDTSTAMAVSLTCFNLGIKVGHVEAGLRTGDLYRPFPEEFNRRIVALSSFLHFSPTKESQTNLIKEGVNERNIYVTGNTVVDALIQTINRIEADNALKQQLYSDLELILGFNPANSKYVLVTGHRRENFGDGIENICKALKILSRDYLEINFIYPVHLNPQVMEPVNNMLKGFDNIHLISPLGYLHFAVLMNNSYLILTDSGGIQEEAPSLGKPVLVMRDLTERPEAVHAGTVEIVGSKAENIVAGVSRLLSSEEAYKAMATKSNPYGDGAAAQRIVSIITDVFAQESLR
jgi:UDP-N-acetylglucosamine 2-epimerase (non-hydrolysing)